MVVVALAGVDLRLDAAEAQRIVDVRDDAPPEAEVTALHRLESLVSHLLQQSHVRLQTQSPASRPLWAIHRA